MAESLQQRGFRRVGIEPNALSMLLADGLRDAVPGIEMVDISSALEPLWWVKEEAEVVQARRAASLCVTGFAEAQRALEEGEAELIAKGRGDRAIFESAAHRFPGCRIQLFSNVISGARTAAGGGHDLPTGRTPEQGDLVFQVWAVNCEGYWALMSRTMQVGAVRDNIQVLFRAVHEAKLAALGRIRPGVTLAQIHEAAISRIPNSLDRSSVVVSVGRGVGAGIGEGPIIDAATPLPLQPGMLLRLGPEIFGPFGAIGFIDTVLVTEEGPEILSQDT
jgi:Xaa-Pro dipeptidase